VTKTPEQLAAENIELRQLLAEANETLEAIRQGGVDAVVVERPGGPQVYTLTGADQPYRVLVEEMQEGAVMLRDDGIILYCNKQTARILRTSHQNLLGTSFGSFLAPESQPVFQSLWQRSRKEVSRGEVTLAAADGTQVAVNLALKVLSPDEPTQTSIVITDLTEYKRYQEVLAAEAFAKERAKELAEADRRKDTFLAMLAHELRNPLAPIRSGIDVLRTVPPNGEQAQQILDMMEVQTRNLVRLIDDLLDVSRITQGKMELRCQRMALSKIITNAIQTAEPLIHAKGHELAVMQTSEILYTHADPARLTQVVANLLNNAAKYTPKGGNISVSTEKIEDEVAIRVKDNGLGIAADMLPRIFEMFVQADSSLTGSQGGLGIGLTLVKNLVEMHGGTVQAASDGLGTGSEFTVRLPILRSGDTVPSEMSHVADRARPFPSHKILVVDDMRPIVFIVATLLRSLGQQVRTAASGGEALAMMEQEKPELVFSDISMPEMDGYALAREIRRRSEWNDIFLIAVSGYGQESDRIESIQAGFDMHIVKPICKEDLERLLGPPAYVR
jgi:PAS domain S-box-containing protein